MKMTVEFEKPIISTLEFLRNVSLTHTVNFGIKSTFSKGLETGFAEGVDPGPGLLYKISRI